jgi:hypothetical protein
MTNEDLRAMRADLTAAIGPLAAANVFFAWAEAIAERMERERLHAAERDKVCAESSDQAPLGRKPAEAEAGP